MAKRSGSGGGLGGISTAALHRELRKRQRKLGTLHKRHQKLLASAAAVESEIRALEGEAYVAPSMAPRPSLTPRPPRPPGKRGPGRPRLPFKLKMPTGTPGPGRKRFRNDTNLVEALAKVLKGKTMGVTEVAAAVTHAGYKTTAANFRTIVNQALLRHTKVFKKVARGKYTAA